MVKKREPASGSVRDATKATVDAAVIRPYLLPDEALLPRDDSGGPGFRPYTMEFGDGGLSVGDGIDVHDIDDSEKYLKRNFSTDGFKKGGDPNEDGERKRRREIPRRSTGG